MRRVLGVPWRSPSYLHLVSIEGLQSFKKMVPIASKKRATFLVLEVFFHGALEGEGEEEMKGFIHGFLKEEEGRVLASTWRGEDMIFLIFFWKKISSS